MKNEKEILLVEIDKLIAYGKEEPTINPALLEFLEVSDLLSIKKNLLNRVGKLSQDDKKWLEQSIPFTGLSPGGSQFPFFCKNVYKKSYHIDVSIKKKKK